jgi:hypothetical protein
MPTMTTGPQADRMGTALNLSSTEKASATEKPAGSGPQGNQVPQGGVQTERTGL